MAAPQEVDDLLLGRVGGGESGMAAFACHHPAAVAAGRAAEEAVGQADTLLTSVSRARSELAGAAERIDASLGSISSDVADAERLGADDQLTRTAVEAARAAIAQGVAARETGDPLAALRALTRAEQDLDNALARYLDAEAQTLRTSQLLERRLRDRATESTGEIGERIALAREQLERAHEFRYMVRNDDIERATAALAALVECELAFAGTMARP